MNQKIIFKNATWFAFLCIGVFFTACKEELDLPTVKIVEVTDITQTSVLAVGEVIKAGSRAVTSRGFCLNMLPNPTVNNSITENGAGTGEFYSNINDLMPNTTYYLRAYAMSQAGIGYSNTMTFTTLSVVLPVLTTG